MLSNKGQFFSPVLIMAGTITGAAEETTAITVSSSKIEPAAPISLSASVFSVSSAADSIAFAFELVRDLKMRAAMIPRTQKMPATNRLPNSGP